MLDEIIVYRTPCGHLYHEECLKSWVQVKLECPSCRQKLPPLWFFNNCFKHIYKFEHTNMIYWWFGNERISTDINQYNIRYKLFRLQFLFHKWKIKIQMNNFRFSCWLILSINLNKRNNKLLRLNKYIKLRKRIYNLFDIWIPMILFKKTVSFRNMFIALLLMLIVVHLLQTAVYLIKYKIIIITTDEST